MFISRRVNDPDWPLQPNKAARTTGLYGHLPKFWDCTTYDFDSGWAKMDHGPNSDGVRPQWHIEMAAEQKEAHADCKRKHMSYPGYLRYISNNNIITFWYWGNPYRHRLIEVIRRKSDTIK